MSIAMTPEELLRTCEAAEPPCVTVVMPTHRGGPETREDPIRLKNLLARAEAALSDRGVEPATAKRILEPAQRLHGDSEFWKHLDLGLAILLDTRGERIERLPYTVEEQVVVDDHFAMRPLLPLLDGLDRFYLMVLSQKRPRLLESDGQNVHEVDLPSRFKDIEDLRAFIDSEKHVQFHTGTAPASAAGVAGGEGSRSAVFHGQGVADNETKTRALELLKRLDEALERTLRGQGTPLVVAGVEWIVAAFRETCSYPHLIDDAVEGNFDHLSDAQLLERALPVVQPVFKQRAEEAAKRYGQAAGTPRGTTDIEQILRTASHGQVELLLVSTEDRIWGDFDPQSGQSEIHADRQSGDRELIEHALLRSLVHGAEAHALAPEQMPAGSPIAAVLRSGGEHV